MSDNVRVEPTLLGAAWRFRWLVLIVTALAVALGFVYLAVNPPQVFYVAQSSMVVQATGGGLDLGASGSDQRFVANQVEILQSGLVAQLASDMATESGANLSAQDLLDFSVVSGSTNSDLVEVIFADTDQNVAITGANALAAAYQQLVSDETTQATEDAIERIDSQLRTLDERAAVLDAAISSANAEDTVRTDLAAQYEDALAEVAKLQAELPTATTTRQDVVRQQLIDLRDVISTYQIVAAFGQEDSALDDLRVEQDQLIARRAALLERKDQISVDLELAPNVVAYFSPAQVAEPSGDAGSGRTLAVALLGGLIAGMGLAYLLATRRRVFHDRAEPQAVLGAPLLADVSDFSEEGLKTRLPVRDAPRSAAAESFRFAAASLELRLTREGAKSLVVISPTLGTGKSTVLANLALAAAREGTRVLLIDADFGNQDLTSLLADDGPGLAPGLTDIVSAGLPFSEAIRPVSVGPDLRVSLMSRGRQPVVAADLLRSPKVKQLFETIKDEYDVVLVDAPPLLQVAYTSTLAAYVDGALVIVGHKSSTGQLEEAHTRLGLIGVTVFGYLYNRSPLRREMTVSEGSMVDILGDLGATVAQERESKKKRR